LCFTPATTPIRTPKHLHCGGCAGNHPVVESSAEPIFVHAALTLSIGIMLTTPSAGRPSRYKPEPGWGIYLQVIAACALLAIFPDVQRFLIELRAAEAWKRIGILVLIASAATHLVCLVSGSV
jgi:hypothetical protein